MRCMEVWSVCERVIVVELVEELHDLVFVGALPEITKVSR